MSWCHAWPRWHRRQRTANIISENRISAFTEREFQMTLDINSNDAMPFSSAIRNHQDLVANQILGRQCCRILKCYFSFVYVYFQICEENKINQIRRRFSHRAHTSMVRKIILLLSIEALAWSRHVNDFMLKTVNSATAAIVAVSLVVH